MARSDQLLHVMAAAVRAGGGIQSTAELAVMMGVPCDSSFRKFLADQVKAGRLRRLVRGYYESVLTPPDPYVAIYQLVRKLRRGFLTYVSLESQLSDTGEISQIIMGHVTLMTRGRAGCFETPYGVLELTHTKKNIAHIMPNLYFDPELKLYRANRQQAIEDLKACRRNLHMLER